MSTIQNNSNYKSVYNSANGGTAQANNVSSPSLSTPVLNTLNQYISSTNNDLVGLSQKASKDVASGDSAALSSDSAKISADYQSLSELVGQISSNSSSLSPSDAQTEAGFLGDVGKTAGLANQSTWDSNGKAPASVSTGSASLTKSFATAEAWLKNNNGTQTESPAVGNAGIGA